eukprot:TRINITY_DN11947_c0_g1_i1.p1 TRINITY_DN11947_c0_g1~~TRINITY_DN11947_c0_g1_i1.p1  ORF type:complete len:255 (+),score=12.69 TRINITY_DN11947_c0_g1_i1:325-1089(+)
MEGMSKSGVQHTPLIEPTPITPFLVARTQVLGGLMCILMIWWTLGPRGGLSLSLASYQGYYNWHPLLMLVGFIFLFGEAILIYRIIDSPRWLRKLLHAFFNAVGLTAAIVGVWFVWTYHELASSPHLTSLHSWLGIFCVTAYGLQWLVGFFMFLLPGRDIDVKRATLPVHALVGVCLFALVLVVACLGILEKLTFLTDAGTITRRGIDTLLGNFIGICILLYGLKVIYTVVFTARFVTEGPETSAKVAPGGTLA